MSERREQHLPPSPPRRIPRRRALGAFAAAAFPGCLSLPGKAAASLKPDTAGTAVRPLYIGTYTSSGGAGIVQARYDPATGQLTSGGSLQMANPSFLTLGNGHVLYATNEYEASVTALRTDGGLRVLNKAGTGGRGPCHLTTHAAGHHLLTANYETGSVAVHALAADGRIGNRTDLVQHTGSGPDPSRQSGPHAHMVLNDPAGNYILAIDLGTDTLHTYLLNTASGRLAAVSRAAARPGAGPRHAAFHPSARYLYVANELDNSITVCGFDAVSGKVTPGPSVPTVPPGRRAAVRNYPAEVIVSADGAYLYVSNRGDDSIARFALNDEGAQATLLDAVSCRGANPRHIALTRDGTWLFVANQNSGTVTTFARERISGSLTPVTACAAVAAACVLPL
ncbi:lactonase family protein [Streptomyces sp. NPDC088387]|uniref:lactonase family protein n=1 Tax=Streptomyces sp. NPDC088387 TaxID=3365859 RepID=UPI0037F94D38